ncbi:serine hydrolase domain-containing protein [Microbacterium sp. CJ88]|uniref:serine hydrolase domain-containing protein n=1 Tax=Microbacterium sp. CJ88 TaxID=3445672 RepID=UPI003F65C79D
MSGVLDAQHWHRRLTELAARHGVPGVQLGMLRLGVDGAPDERVEVATGVLSTRTGFAASPDALFQIGSITKAWTATLVLMLVDEGRLGLDTPVAEIIPGFALADPEVARAVTVRHLLTHTSGIDGDLFVDTGRGDDCLERYLGVLASAEQSHPLGATWSYCNAGYSLLGRIVEVLTDRTWDDALRERLTGPLGLSRTATLPEDVLLHAAAIGHRDDDGEPVPVSRWHLPRSAGPGGAVSAAAGDLLDFARMHLAGGLLPDGTRVLSAESAAAMASHQVDLPDPYVLGDSWGLGWIRYDWSGHRLYGHDGNTLGQAAFLRVLPKQGLAVTLLANGGHTRDLFEELYREIFDEVAGIGMRPPFAPPEVPVEVDVTPFLGRYARVGSTLEVEQGADGPLLRTTATGPVAALLGGPPQEFALHPVEPGTFAVRPPGTDTWLPVTFYRLADGGEYIHFGARAAGKAIS